MANCIRCHKPIDDTPFCPLCGAKQSREKGKKRRGNGQGCVFKRKGKNTWSVKITTGYYVRPDGKKIQRQTERSGFKTKADADRFCALYIANMVEKQKAPSLIHYWEMFESGDLQKLSANRIGIHKKAWQRLEPLHYIPVDKITLAEMRACVASETSTYYPAKAMKTLLAHLFRLADADGHVRQGITDHIVLPPLNEEERQPFTPEEQALLWNAYEAGVPNVDIPLIFIYTGIMTGELRRLRVTDIDFDKREISGIGLKTKIRRKLTVLLPRAILPLLQDRCTTAKEDGRLFGMDEKIFYRIYYEALEKAGVRPLTPYSCRHTTGTALGISENVAPQTIQRILRWSKGTSGRVMDTYIQPSQTDAFDALDRIATKNQL